MSAGMAFLLPVVVLVIAAFAAREPLAYECFDGTRFTLTASPTKAVVRFSDREYRLLRKSSALAVKYTSKSATLYLDGDFAAFIADDRPLPGCFKALPGERG